MVRLWPRLGGGSRGGMVWWGQCWWSGGRGWVLCWTGVSAFHRVLWVLCVCAARSRRSLAGGGVEIPVGAGCLAIWVGLWPVGSGWRLLDGACWYGVRIGGLLVVLECFLYALVLLVPVCGPPLVNGGVRWPESCEPVQWGR